MIYQGYDYKISVEITCGECNKTTSRVDGGGVYWAKIRMSADLAAAMDRLKCECGGRASRLTFDRRLLAPPSLTGGNGQMWEERWVLVETKRVAE